MNAAAKAAILYTVEKYLLKIIFCLPRTTMEVNFKIKPYIRRYGASYPQKQKLKAKIKVDR